MINIISSDGQISFDEYVQAVHGYNCGQGLAVIGQLSRAIEFNNPILKKSKFRDSIPRTVNQWQLAFLAKTLIERSNDFKRKELNDESLIQTSDLYNKIRDPRIGNPSVVPDGRDVLNFMIRTSYEQFPLQSGNYHSEISRAFILFDEIATATPSDEFKVAEAFLNLTGLTVREFMLIGFAYWAQAEKPTISPMTTSVPSLRDILLPEKQQKFLGLVSANYVAFRACQDKQEKKPEFEKFQFNCLQTYPLVRSEKFKPLLCPIPTFLLKRFTRGIYYYLLDAYNEGEKKNQFSSFFGKYIFEPYVGNQLRHYFPSERVFGERDIGKSEKTCDWIVVEDDFVVLIECKTTGLTVRSKTLADTEQIAIDLKRRIVSGVQACERTREAISKGHNGLSAFAGKPTINLIILYDEVYLFNAPPYQELVDAELKVAGLDGVRYQVSPIADFEYALPALVKSGLGKFLSSKLGDPDRRSWDISVLIQRLVKEGQMGEPERNTLLDAKFKSVFDPLLSSGKSVAD